MTTRERVLAALRGEPHDRVPVWTWGIHPQLGDVHPSIQPVVDAYLERGDTIVWHGFPTPPFVTASDQVSVRGERRPSALPDFDESWTFYITPAGELSQSTYVSHFGRPGYQKKYLLETEADVEAMLSVPYVPVRPDPEPFFEAERRLGDGGIAMVSLPFDPMYGLNHLCGSETFALWTVDRRDLVRLVIAELLRRLTDWLDHLLSRGVGPLFGYVGPELCIPPLQSPADFEEFVVEPNRVLHDRIRAAGGIGFVHCHGKVNQVLEGFVRMHADALHPIEPPPMGDVALDEAVERVGGKLCIVGNVQEHDILTMPTPQFREMGRATVETGKRTGRFILSCTATPFGWPTMTDLARDNWLAMLGVGLEAGRY
ncbi:MAG: hypothetical protein HYU66_28950 [Armatimonadetes bacterium]|nr:hypothetical protein [Armatimonadota bacterium]